MKSEIFSNQGLPKKKLVHLHYIFNILFLQVCIIYSLLDGITMRLIMSVLWLWWHIICDSLFQDEQTTHSFIDIL